MHLVESRTATIAWQSFRPVEGSLVEAFDASGLLDSPAGKHGFLQVKDGRFAFEDGTPVRFFGVNIQAPEALPAHEQAERVAERLAQLGVDLVRLHHLDAPWAEPNIFDPTVDDTQHLSAESLDRLDYFIAQLKQRGIYVYLDLLVHREFRRGDQVPKYRRLEGGAKIVAQYHPRLIQLQKQYARDLLTHYNPYTKSRLVDEPAMALVELINESSLLLSTSHWSKTPSVYLDELGRLWREYTAGQGVDEFDPRSKRYLNHDDPLTQEFYAKLQLRYFEELQEYLRQLGLKVPIAGSNKNVFLRAGGIEGWDLLTNASMDFIDRHAYWDHPQGGFGDLVKFHNQPLTEAVDRHNPLVKLSVQRVAGKPFVVSEWNVAWPNEYRAVGPMLMAAYALFQDWDGLLLFNYQGDLAPSRITSNFDVSTKPELWLQLPTVARLFHRRDVQPAQQRLGYPLMSQAVIPAPLALLHGLEWTIERSTSMREPDVPTASSWASDTGELRWDAAQGVVVIETANTQAVLGRLGGRSLALRDVTVRLDTPFACVLVTSLDDQPIGRSRHLLLTTVARSENTGTVYNATRTVLRDSGTDPILMEPVVGVASFPLWEREVPAVFALDAGGRRASEAAIRMTDRTVDIQIGQGHVYEIVYEEPS